jgi:hypothetical protein
MSLTAFEAFDTHMMFSGLIYFSHLKKKITSIKEKNLEIQMDDVSAVNVPNCLQDLVDDHCHGHFREDITVVFDSIEQLSAFHSEIYIHFKIRRNFWKKKFDL